MRCCVRKPGVQGRLVDAGVDANVDVRQFEPIDGGICDDAGACRNGFRCQAGHCELDGNGGRLQVTLRWNEYQDLDLYVDEPGNGLSYTVFLNSGNYCVGRFGADSVSFCRADA